MLLQIVVAIVEVFHFKVEEVEEVVEKVQEAMIKIYDGS